MYNFQWLIGFFSQERQKYFEHFQTPREIGAPKEWLGRTAQLSIGQRNKNLGRSHYPRTLSQIASRPVVDACMIIVESETLAYLMNFRSAPMMVVVEDISAANQTTAVQMSRGKTTIGPAANLGRLRSRVSSSVPA